MQDADEDFSMLLKFPPDYPLADLYALSERLAAAEVCVPGYVPPPVGLFHPDGFFYDQHIERSKTILITTGTWCPGWHSWCAAAVWRRISRSERLPAFSRLRSVSAPIEL